jgi:hypothetical protein
VPKAMAADKVIPGWGHQRYRDALKALVLLHRDHDRLAGGSGGAVSG